MLNQFQHGDVLGQRIDKIPSGAKKVEARAGRYILAEGEATGHAHTIIATADIELFEKDGTMYLRCGADCELTHEEHHTQTIEPGDYEIQQVVEVDPFENEIRTVAD